MDASVSRCLGTGRTHHMGIRQKISLLFGIFLVLAFTVSCGSSGPTVALTGSSATNGGGTGGTGGTGATGGTGGTNAGTATLLWVAPTTNTDGSPATVTGYRVYYGTASGTYTNKIDAGTTTTYTVTNLSPGTYYFAVTAYDSSGNESAFSDEVSKSI